MIPVIEATMVKLDIYSRSYAFRAQVQQVENLKKKILHFGSFKVNSHILRPINS